VETLGKRIKYYREQLGLSQIGLSEKTNVSQASIARIESGIQKNLKRETMRKLAAGLGVSLTQLMEPSMTVREEEASYNATRMIPVARARDIGSLKDINTLSKKADTFEPSLSADKNAFYLEVTSDLMSGPVIEVGDMILVEPSAEIKEGDMVIYLSPTKRCLGKIYYHHNNLLIQPLNQDIPPIMLKKRDKTKYRIGIFRIREIRKKYGVTFADR